MATESSTTQSDRLKAVDMIRTAHYGYITTAYKPHRWWFVILLKYIAFGIALATALPTNLSVKIFISIVVFMVEGVSVLILLPYRRAFRNWLVSFVTILYLTICVILVGAHSILCRR